MSPKWSPVEVKARQKILADGKPPPPSTPKNGVTGNMFLLLALYEEALSSEENFYGWFLDNGATKNIINNSNYFTGFEIFETIHGITAACSKILPAVYKTTLKIMIKTKKARQFKEMKEVWFVPSISKNLFPVLATQDRQKNRRFESTAEESKLKINNGHLYSIVEKT